jgi:glycosyltransferase involved in cell wall biosynthesis
MINIAYIANPTSIHDCKWINHFNKKHNIIIICSEFFKDSFYLDQGIKVYRILPEFPHKNIIKRNRILSTLNKIVENESIDIVHTMYAFPNAFWVNLIQFKNHIITTRGSDVLVDYKNLFKPHSSIKEQLTNKYFIKQFHDSFNNAKYITSTSISQQEIIRNFLIDHKKLKLIRTGIDISDFIEIVEKAKRNEIEAVIFSPRSMMPIYNIDIIIKAFNQVLKKHPKMKLVLINDVPNEIYASEILHLINKLGLVENCIVTNKLTKKEMVEWYMNSKVVVSIPRTDGSPNSVLEAMLARRSIIMGDYNYDSHLFSNIPKLKINTQEELTSKIVELIENPVDSKILDCNFKLGEQFAR